VDTIIEKDQEWRKSNFIKYIVRYNLDTLKKEWNDIGRQIRDKKKANKQDPCE
jgi:seryl-tRNA synthetase